ncbi:hypothetical protein Pst134EA_017803 [Puccinia striiformis f. sp. tritici]|uniref:hypothetical protein n=2 Tax=Puccinia striiformis f. sp. tritici TaxID=168172 RepID=UPI00200741B3|nr:hypothetical protein Pst134EA_017803 [Puccinia striiformis f. sp. tritici]KAH9461499.1 hypothetical protein Pst134EA_017803 [Puccinia striiformis f. sp. tritici]
MTSQALVDFVKNLPLSVNPYEATAEKIKQETRIAEPALWGLVLRRITAFNFFVLCGQAIAVLWLRKKANKLHFFRRNKLGLIHVEMLNELVLLMFLFSLLAFIDLITQELAEKDVIRFSSKLVLQICKFPFSAVVSWRKSSMFLWILCIETAMNVTSLGARARNGASIRLSPPVCFALNGILVALMFTPGALLLWVSVDGANALRAIEHSSRKIIALLLQSAPTYRPENYSYLSVLEIAKPIVAISPNIKRFAYDLRFMLYLFLVQHSLIAVIYFPLFIIVLRSLRRQISPMELPEKRFVGDHTTKKRNAIDKVRKRIIKHACLVYLQEILYCPPVLYLLFAPTRKVSQFSDPRWILVEQVGVHGPTAIIGNIILAFLIQNAWEIHKKHLKLVVAAAEIYPQLVPEGGKSHRVFESSCS